MLKVSRLKSYFDKDTKIWSGEKYTKYYGNECSVGRILFEELRKRPKKICQISGTEKTQLTNEEVLLQAIRIAKYFQKLDMQQSHIIGITCRNTTYLISVVLACFFTGNAYHAINPNHDEKTSGQLFNVTKPKLIFCDGQDYVKIRSATSDLNVLKIITLKQRVEGVPFVMDLLEAVEGEEQFLPAELENGMEQTLAILCSSGSTGLPKAVTIPNTTKMYAFASPLTDEDVIFLSSTMDWISGIILLTASIVHGAKLIISDQPYSPDFFLQIAEKYDVTVTIHAPTHIAMLLQNSNISANKLSSIKVFCYGGGKCSISNQIKMRSYLTNGNCFFMYGMTEFGDMITYNDNFEHKPNSVGSVLPGFKLKITDDEGQNLEPGVVGEICMYSDQKWLGYYGNPRATTEVLDEEGWFHSGDLGYMDEDGYLFVVDRKKDILKCHAMQYWPNEIEDVILELPDVLDVCVFGVWNDVDGDAAAAAVTISEGSTLSEQKIVKHVAARISVHYKQLKAGAIILKELPKTSNGKLDRKALLPIYLKIKESQS